MELGVSNFPFCKNFLRTLTLYLYLYIRLTTSPTSTSSSPFFLSGIFKEKYYVKSRKQAQMRKFKTGLPGIKIMSRRED